MTQSIEEAERELAAKALRDRQMPSPSYEAIDVEAGRYDQHSAVQAALAGIKLGREQAAEIAAALDSNRGNEKEIAQAIRSLI